MDRMRKRNSTGFYPVNPVHPVLKKRVHPKRPDALGSLRQGRADLRRVRIETGLTGWTDTEAEFHRFLSCKSCSSCLKKSPVHNGRPGTDRKNHRLRNESPLHAWAGLSGIGLSNGADA